VGVDVVGFDVGFDVVGLDDGVEVGIDEVGFNVVGRDVGVEVGIDVVGWDVGVEVGADDGFGVGASLGAELTLGALVMSTHVKLDLSSMTHESNMASPTSATTRVMLFHNARSPWG
jgi:hypothetical protein